MLSVEDLAEIRRLHFAEGIGVKTIARRLDIARNTVRAAVRDAVRSAVHRPIAEPEIRKLLKDCPTMPATVIAEGVGWERGITVLKERVAELRPLFLEPDPYQRTDFLGPHRDESAAAHAPRADAAATDKRSGVAGVSGR